MNSPTSLLYTTRQYPCGCRAEGTGDVPSYCSEHGVPIPLASNPMTQEEIGAHKRRGHMSAMHFNACPICNPQQPKCVSHATEHRVRDTLPCPWCAIDELKENRDRLQALIRRAVEWEPVFPVECTLLDELNAAANGGTAETPADCHGLDTTRQVFFYEQDFYVLSNFSAFCVHWRGKPFFTSEHAYHWARFELPEGRGVLLQDCVQRAASAHEAFKFAQAEKSKQRPDWDAVKVATMRDILRAKADQHEYVARKLEATGGRELIENSWRDGFWGWGPNRDGQNMLGKLWMEVRAERRAVKTSCELGIASHRDCDCKKPVAPICSQCETELAFEGDVCGLCFPVAQP
jgi:ribA/ribD-fused uncharacterized protein